MLADRDKSRVASRGNGIVTKSLHRDPVQPTRIGDDQPIMEEADLHRHAGRPVIEITMKKGVGDDLAECEIWVCGSIVHATVWRRHDHHVETSPSPGECFIQHPGNRSSDRRLVPCSRARWIRRERCCRSLDDEAREPLLRMDSQGQQAGDSRCAVGKGHARTPEQLGIVTETTQALRIAVTRRAQEGRDEITVEISPGGPLYRFAVEHRRLPGSQECLLLKSGQPEVAIVAPDVRSARRGDPAWFRRRVALVNPSNDHWCSVDLPVADRELDRRCERSRLLRQTLFECLRIRQRHRPESRRLIETEDDGPTSRMVRQGAQGGRERLWQPSCRGLHLDLGVVASGVTESIDEFTQILLHTPNVTTGELHLRRSWLHLSCCWLHLATGCTGSGRMGTYLII